MARAALCIIGALSLSHQTGEAIGPHHSLDFFYHNKTTYTRFEEPDSSALIFLFYFYGRRNISAELSTFGILLHGCKERDWILFIIAPILGSFWARTHSPILAVFFWAGVDRKSYMHWDNDSFLHGDTICIQYHRTIALEA